MIPPEDSAQLEAAWRTGEEMIGLGEESVRERVELNKLLLNTRLLIREDKRLVYIAGCQFVTMATKNKLVGGVHIIIANNYL